MSSTKLAQLSRRDLIRLGSTASLGLLLAGCGSAQQIALVSTPTGDAQSTATPMPTSTTTSTLTSGVPTNTPSPSPSPIPSATNTPMPTHTPMPTATEIPPTETPKPTPTPKPLVRPRNGDIVFLEDFRAPAQTGIVEIGHGRLDRWANYRTDGAAVSFVTAKSVFDDPAMLLDVDGKQIEYVMKVTIGDKPVSHPDWGSDPLWYAVYPGWENGLPAQTLGAPCAVQVDLLKPLELAGSFMSVHRLNEKTGDRASVAGYEIEPNGRVKLVTRDGYGGDQKVYLNHALMKKSRFNRLRLEFSEDGTVLPFINNELAYQNNSKQLNVGVKRDYRPGFVDAHPGFQISVGPSGNPVPKPGTSMYNANFRIEKNLR